VATEGGKVNSNIDQSLPPELDALADMKFSFVIACQKFGEYKSNNDPRAQDIIDLMARYASENMDIYYNNN
jgi:callose synthase